MERKGFIHVVEIVVISLVVFILVVQFSTIPGIKAEWDRTKLFLQGNDIVFSMERAGVNWLNPDDVESMLSGMVSDSNLNYAVTVNNAIKNRISVACLCTEPEKSQLQSILTPFTLNGESISFNVTRYDYTQSARAGFTLQHDVLYFGSSFLEYPLEDLDDYYSDFRTYMRNDRGVVLEQDLTGDLFEEGQEGRVLENIFGISNSSGFVGGQNITFSADPSSEYYKLEKYFRYIPSDINFTGWRDSWPGIGSFLLSTETAAPSGEESQRAVMSQKVTGAAAMIANDRMVENRGRAVWLSAGMPDPEARETALKSAFAWAAGGTFNAVDNFVPNPTYFTMHTVISQDPNPMMQPVQIVLSLGYIF